MVSARHVILFFVLAGQAITSAQTNFYDHEKRLRTDILTGYEYKIRPEATVQCDIRLSVLNINILDVTGQLLSISAWLTVRWNDSRLTWDSSAYGGITDIYDTELVLWRPQLIVDNEIANLEIIESDKLLIRATHTGEMIWEPPSISQTHCDVDVTFYPFDTQLCVIEVTSWSYKVNEVDLEARDASVYLKDFQLSGEWEILSTWSERRLLLDGNDEEFSQIDFNLRLRRRPSYYVMTILIPVVVTSILCILVFLLPAESGEKVGYTLTILLTYVVMLTLVAGYLPPTSKTTSLLSIYITIVLFVGVFSTLATVFVLYFHHHVDKPVYDWMVTLWSKVFIPISGWKKPKSDCPEDSEPPEGLDVYISSPTRERNKVRPSSGEVNVSITTDTSPKRPSTAGTSSQNLSDHRPQLTWQDLSVILDKALFKVLGIFILLLTVLVLLALIIGGYS